MDRLFQGRPKIGCTDTSHMAKLFDPRQILLAAIVGGAARDQSAHAMTDQRNLSNCRGKDCHQFIDQAGQLTTIVGDMSARVVADINWCKVQISMQP